MRARNIKPGWLDNTVLGSATPYAQILFGALPMLADKAGRLKDDPLWIQAKIFPYRKTLEINGDLTTIDSLIKFLADNKFIIRYEAQGKRYIQITNFHEHQRPHHTEKESVIPNNVKLTVNTTLDNGGNPPDSLIPDSYIALPASEFEKVFSCLESLISESTLWNLSLINTWLGDGCDAELDIIPTIRRLTKKKKPSSLSYYSQAIADAKALRLAPMPKGNANATTGSNNAGYSKPTKTDRLYAGVNKAAINGGYAFDARPSGETETSGDASPMLPKPQGVREGT